MVASILVSLLYTSRAVYNLVAVCPVSREKKLPSFGYGWINVTDQVGLTSCHTESRHIPIENSVDSDKLASEEAS